MLGDAEDIGLQINVIIAFRHPELVEGSVLLSSLAWINRASSILMDLSM